MSRTAVGRTRPQFPAEEPPEPRLENGTLIIVGGGGSPPGLMERFIELAGGPDHAYLVYIPCSEAEEINEEPGMVDSWRRLGVRSVTWIHTKDREKANTDEWILDKLRKATGIWFGGGRQWNLVDSYQHTTAHKLMHRVLERGGVIGGSSAGASIQGSYMARGNPMGNVDPMADGYETGLGLITGMAIDQHFTQRGRLPDMTALVNRYPQLLGVGLDEASSIIAQGSVAEVFTREGRNVHFYDRKIPVEEDKPDYIELVHGQLFDLVERKVLTPEVDITAEAAAEAAGEAVEGVAGEQNPFVGTWDVTAYTEGGENTSTLQINPDLTLSFETPQFEVEATNLTIEGNQISFEISSANFPQSALFQGQLEEGVLTGSISFGGETFADLEGHKRAVENAPVAAPVSGATAFIGKWEITSSSEFGENTNILRIEPDLSASYESGEFPAEISNLKIDGNQLSYELQFGNFEGMMFQGKLEEGVLTGTISFQGQVFAVVRGRKLDGESPENAPAAAAAAVAMP